MHWRVVRRPGQTKAVLQHPGERRLKPHIRLPAEDKQDRALACVQRELCPQDAITAQLHKRRKEAELESEA